jgi:Toprim domain
MIKPSEAAELAARLARRAEQVCRHYLSNGRREGSYWLVGDVANTPGRSLFVRLKGPSSGKGAAGKWTDAATGEHGDLLDLIATNRGLLRLPDVLAEARLFLNLPRCALVGERAQSRFSAATGSTAAARRLFAVSRPIEGTIAETYLRGRGIAEFRQTAALRFHPRCYYRADADGPRETWPALIAAVTDLGGRLTGVHRTWLTRCGDDKAPVVTPRRALGYLLGYAVRFGIAEDVMAAGEGIETMLSVRAVAPFLPTVAALSAHHLAAIRFPPTLRRLYVARDNDPAGNAAMVALTDRARAVGIEALTLSPCRGDFNDDLRGLGVDGLRAALRTQLAPEDVIRFMPRMTEAGTAG